MKEQSNKSPSKYEFTKDWFSAREESWQNHFGELADRPSHALEIGSLEGRSAVWMLDNLLVHPESTLTCIDLFHNPEIEGRFDRNLQATGESSKLLKLKGQSWGHLRTLPPKTFDLIYIDGSHHGQHVIEDAILSFRLLRPRGFLIFDDYPWTNDAGHSVYPKDAIDAFVHLYQESLDVLFQKWQVYIQKR